MHSGDICKNGELGNLPEAKFHDTSCLLLTLLVWQKQLLLEPTCHFALYLLPGKLAHIARRLKYKTSSIFDVIGQTTQFYLPSILSIRQILQERISSPQSYAN